MRIYNDTQNILIASFGGKLKNCDKTRYITITAKFNKMKIQVLAFILLLCLSNVFGAVGQTLEKKATQQEGKSKVGRNLRQHISIRIHIPPH
jgi:hypothetical protein